MGTQRLGAKLCRRIERETEQEVEFACGSGDYTFEFVTPDHRHGWWNKKTGEWGWHADGPLIHFANGCAPFDGGEDNSQGYRKSTYGQSAARAERYL